MADIELTDPTADSSIDESTGGVWGNDNPASTGGDASPKFYLWTTVKEWVQDAVNSLLTAAGGLKLTYDDAGASLSIHAPWHTGFKSGNWYCPFIATITSNGCNPTTAVVAFTPLKIFETVTIDQLGIRTSSTGGNMALGIYASDATTRRPTGNPLAQTASTAQVGATLQTIALTSSVQLTPGAYWLAVKPSSTGSTFQSTINTSSWSAYEEGSSTAANIVSGSTTGGGTITYTDPAGYNSGTLPDMTGQSPTMDPTVQPGNIIFHITSKP